MVKEEEEIPGEIDYEDDPDEVALRKALTLQEAYTGIETKREHLLPRKEAKKMKKQREASIKKMKEKKGFLIFEHFSNFYSSIFVQFKLEEVLNRRQKLRKKKKNLQVLF